MNKSITILSFSSRKEGNCEKICNFIADFYNRTNVFHYMVNIETFPPCGNCDYECMLPECNCPNITQAQKDIMDMICNSRVVYFVVPNYCGFPCANYFAFNERTVGYFDLVKSKLDAYLNVPKRFIIISNSEGFEEAMQQQTAEQPTILYLKSKKYKRQSIAGDLMDVQAAKDELFDFLSKAVHKLK